MKQNPAHLDETKVALAGLRGLLTNKNAIGCIVLSKEAGEMRCWAINALVPASVVPEKSLDSTLYVFDSNVSDSLLVATTIGRKPLWKEKSSNFYFVLVGPTAK